MIVEQLTIAVLLFMMMAIYMWSKDE